jgi:hypothetical protein
MTNPFHPQLLPTVLACAPELEHIVDHSFLWVPLIIHCVRYFIFQITKRVVLLCCVPLYFSFCLIPAATLFMICFDLYILYNELLKF